MPAGDASAGDQPRRFEFATAARIVVGPGSSADLPSIAAAFGRRVFLVTGSRPDRWSALAAALEESSDELARFAIEGEPTVAQVEAGVCLARKSKSDVVVAVGGGSAIDAGKAIAALAANHGAALDYLEVAGRGQSLERPTLPVIAAPTTAGTGAEVTRNAVLAVPEARMKASLRSASMLPRVALVDADLTHGLPPDVTAATGMDALTQLIEPYLSCRANPMTDAWCRDGIPRAARALEKLRANPRDAQARGDMALAALFSGLALANSGLGAVHGFAAPLGGLFPAPHGAVCAALLPHVLRTNLAALRARDSHNPALARMEDVARWLTGSEACEADDAARWCADLGRSLAIPNLAAWGVCRDHVGEIAVLAARASSMKANPIALSEVELTEILEAALEA